MATSVTGKNMQQKTNAANVPCKLETSHHVPLRTTDGVTGRRHVKCVSLWGDEQRSELSTSVVSSVVLPKKEEGRGREGTNNELM